MDGGALDDALEAGGGLGVTGAFGDEAGQVLVEEFGQVALQLVHIHAAGPQHGHRFRVVAEREQQVFEGRVFVPAVVASPRARWSVCSGYETAWSTLRCHLRDKTPFKGAVGTIRQNLDKRPHRTGHLSIVHCKDAGSGGPGPSLVSPLFRRPRR
jgi:hypothetical protein